MEKLIITAAICGAEVTKEQNPAVPYTVEEIVREAKSAVDAGAAIVHLHVREDDGTPTQSRARFQECEDAIYKACPNVILIPSTGGAVGMTPDERLQSTDTTPIPEMATLDCGTCNFGDEIFDNTMPTMRAFGKRMIERGIKPEYECFEMGHLDTILTMARKGEVPGAPMQFNFVLGVPGCTPATVDNLCWLVKNIPAGSTWTSTGIGRHAFTLAAPTIVPRTRRPRQEQRRTRRQSRPHGQAARSPHRHLRRGERDPRTQEIVPGFQPAIPIENAPRKPPARVFCASKQPRNTPKRSCRDADCHSTKFNINSL